MNASSPGPAGEEQPSERQVRVRVFARTDVGLIREHNEDDFLVADLTRRKRTLMPDVQAHEVGPGGSLFVVCDGMGGAAAGEVASRAAVDTIFEHMTAGGAAETETDLVGRLDHAIIEAGSRIFALARLDQTRRGMGTTCSAALVVNGRLFAAQVGDSRCYLIRNGLMQQMTRDQSLLTQLIEAGQVRLEDADNFEHSNIILQALGTTEMVNTDVTYHDLCRGDTLVMCSDGLSGMVDNGVILRMVLENPEPLHACRALTEQANAAGGEDNITVVVAVFEGSGLPPMTPQMPLQFARYPKPRPTMFDRVPYTIPNQMFLDGGTAIPSRPEVPLGAVSVAEVISESAAAAAARAAEPPIGAVEPGMTVLEMSDEGVPNGRLPVGLEKRGPGLWSILAFVILAGALVVLVVLALQGCRSGGGDRPAAPEAAGEAEPRVEGGGHPEADGGNPGIAAADVPSEGGSGEDEGAGGVPRLQLRVAPLRQIRRLPDLRPQYPGNR